MMVRQPRSATPVQLAEWRLMYFIGCLLICFRLFANVARISPGYNMQFIGCLPHAYDSRNKKMAATVEVTATFSLVLFTIQTSKVPAEGNMM